MKDLSTPHGTLGTAPEDNELEVKSGLSTPHGTLGTVYGVLNQDWQAVLTFQLHTVH